MAALARGDTIGRYRIRSRLGQGGMGLVYLAVDQQLEREVALKVIAAHLADDAEFRARFIAEARAAAAVDHPHLLPIYEAGSDGERLFLAMRYVRGFDLATIIAREGAVPAQRTARLVEQVGSALEAAHAAGLVHRDVKPANILVGPGEHAYLADFGLATAAAASRLTRPGLAAGSAEYMAPEVAGGGQADARSDLYALACVAYACLTGRPPFRRDDEIATLYAHVHDAPPPPSSVRDDVPAAVEPVLARALAKDPAERHGSATEFAAEFAAAITLGRPADVAAAGPEVEVQTPLARRRPVPVWLAAAAGGVAIALLGALALGAPITGPSRPSAGPSVTMPGLAAGLPTPPADTEPTNASDTLTPTVETPSGTRIIFSRRVRVGSNEPPPGAPADYLPGCDGENDAKLYLIDPDRESAEAYRLFEGTDLFELAPASSRDGSTIVMLAEVQNRTPGIFVATADGEIQHELEPETEFVFGGPGDPSVSPDGGRVVYAAMSGWEVASVDGNEEPIVGLPPELAESGETPPLFLVDVAFLSDDRLIAVLVDESQQPPRVVLNSFAFDGSDAREFALDLEGVFPAHVAVSPDGRQLAFSSFSGGPEAPQSAIYVADLPDGEPRRISATGTSASFPTWSPDGLSLAYSAGEPGSEQLWTTRLDTGESRQLTAFDDAMACASAWSVAPPNLVQPRPAPEPGSTLPFERGILEPGHYRVSKFQPNVELDVPAGPHRWWSFRNYVDGFTLDRVGDEASQVAIGLIQTAYTTPCPDTELSVLIESDPAATMAWLRTRSEIAMSPPLPINLGGYPGLTTDIELMGEGCAELEANDRTWLFLIGEDNAHLDRSDKAMVVVVNVRGTAVTFISGSTKAGFEEFVEAASPLIESITFPTD